jgi:membrane fusion protein (multidrug efflux system)
MDKVPVISQSAAQENQEGRFVYVLDEKDLPRMVYIKTNGQTPDGKWIVSQGVKEGDRVITSGLQSVMPGKPVRIINAKTEENVKVEKTNIFKKGLDKIKNLFK